MCHDDCEKHFPGRRRYILFVTNSRQNPETIMFVLTSGFFSLRSFDLFSAISLFKMKRSTKYQAQGKAKQKKKKIRRQEQTLTSSTTTVYRSIICG